MKRNKTEKNILKHIITNRLYYNAVCLVAIIVMGTRILSQKIFYMFCVCIPFLIRAHRYANFVLILISLQVTDYKIDNYNILNTANQRREKNILISKHLTRQSIDKH